MSPRIECWLHGHQWRHFIPPTMRDIVGNTWAIQACGRCSATRRRLIARWSDA